MRLGIDEIIDYKECPQYYKFKYVDLFPERKDIRDYFDDAIKQTIFFYYFSMIDKKEKSIGNLLEKWEKLWFVPEIQEVFPEEEFIKTNSDAVELIRNFHGFNMAENIFPVAVDFKYETVFQGDVNLHLCGSIDLIKVVNDKTRKRETDLVFFSRGRTLPDEFMLSMNLKYTMASHAFRKNFGAREKSIIYCNIGKKSFAPVKKEATDYDRAIKIIYNIANGIENRIFYPAENPITCSRCKYKAFCLNEKTMEDKGNVICKRPNN